MRAIAEPEPVVRQKAGSSRKLSVAPAALTDLGVKKEQSKGSVESLEITMCPFPRRETVVLHFRGGRGREAGASVVARTCQETVPCCTTDCWSRAANVFFGDSI